METDQSEIGTRSQSEIPMKLLFVKMGVDYDQHGCYGCSNVISSNSIPAFRRGNIPGVSFEQMKLEIKLGVPYSLHQSLDIVKVKSVFPYVIFCHHLATDCLNQQGKDVSSPTSNANSRASNNQPHVATVQLLPREVQGLPLENAKQSC